MLTKLEANAEARGLDRGIDIGIEKGALENDIKWINNGKLSIEDVCNDLGISIEELKAKAKDLGLELKVIVE